MENDTRPPSHTWSAYGREYVADERGILADRGEEVTCAPVAIKELLRLAQENATLKAATKKQNQLVKAVRDKDRIIAYLEDRIRQLYRNGLP